MKRVNIVIQGYTLGDGCRILNQPATEGLFNNRTEHVYRRLQVDLKRSKPEAIVAIVVSIVATFFAIVATFFTIVQHFSNSLKLKIMAIVATFFPYMIDL